MVDTDSRLAAVTLAALVAVALASSAATAATDCAHELLSVVPTSGRPGAAVELHGLWGPYLGTEVPTLNRGGANPAAVLGWTPEVVRLRVPEHLAPGTYKIGVVCFEKGHYSGEGWPDFEVLAGDVVPDPGERATPPGPPRDDPLARAFLALDRAKALTWRGEAAAAAPLLEEAVEGLRAAGSPFDLGIALQGRGAVRVARDDVAGGRKDLVEAAGLYRDLLHEPPPMTGGTFGPRWNLAGVLWQLSRLEAKAGNRAGQRVLLIERLTEIRKLEPRFREGIEAPGLEELARLELEDGDPATAAGYYRQAAAAYDRKGDPDRAKTARSRAAALLTRPRP